jgi:hypothetical protein
MRYDGSDDSSDESHQNAFPNVHDSFCSSSVVTRGHRSRHGCSPRSSEGRDVHLPHDRLLPQNRQVVLDRECEETATMPSGWEEARVGIEHGSDLDPTTAAEDKGPGEDASGYAEEEGKGDEEGVYCRCSR